MSFNYVSRCVICGKRFHATHGLRKRCDDCMVKRKK